MSFPPVITVGQLAEQSGVPLWKVRRLFDAGKLNCSKIRIGEVRAILAEDHDAVMRKLKEFGGK